MSLVLLWEVLGGLGLFILGMKSMSEGLQKLAGERVRRSLEKITGNRLTAALMGSCLASLLQSSSAASILVVGFVNAGLVSIYQALAVLLGTGIGSTLAIQFIAFKVSYFALPFVFVGVILTFFSRKRKLVYVGNLLLGAGLVFLGLQIMEAGFSPISQNDILRGLQNRFFSWRISAVFVGAFLTVLMQSGSAATGIIIVMAGSGLLGFETGIAMVVGEVLGTSLITAVAAVNGTLAAKRTAFLYFTINSFAVCMVILFFPLFMKIVQLVSPGQAEFTISNLETITLSGISPTTKPYIARHLANAHTLFNFLNALIFLPLIGFFARSATIVLPGKNGEFDSEPRTKYIDVRVINTPTIALLQVKNELKRMAGISRVMFDEIVAQFYKYDAKRSARIQQKVEVLNILQHEISTFLVLLSRQPLSSDISIGIPMMLQIVNALKYQGDQNKVILELLRHKKEDKIAFSTTAMSELKALAAKVEELVHQSVNALDEEASSDPDQARTIQEDIRHMLETMLHHHMKRLTSGKCTVSAGLVYGDIISSFDKISDYSCRILEMERELFNATSNGSN
jgi:phosphate:Na+ symporter